MRTDAGISQALLPFLGAGLFGTHPITGSYRAASLTGQAEHLIQWRARGIVRQYRHMFNPILPLTLDDLPDCLALAQDREWLPEDHKWRLLFAVGTVYGLRDEAGDLVGTTVLTRYGTELAAVSMVLVAARYGGQGLGRRLMTHALVGAWHAIVFIYAN